MKNRKMDLKSFRKSLQIAGTFLLILFMIAANPITALAASTVTTISSRSYADLPNYLNTYDMIQYHYQTTEKYVWVKGYMNGQATGGTKLKKGDSMSYTYSKGSGSPSVSVSCGVSYYGVGASVSIALPFTKTASNVTVSSISRVAQSTGKYKLYGKLKYKITTKTTYQRSVSRVYDSKTRKYKNKYGKWKYCLTRSKKYMLISDESYLSKIK